MVQTLFWHKVLKAARRTALQGLLMIPFAAAYLVLRRSGMDLSATVTLIVGATIAYSLTQLRRVASSNNLAIAKIVIVDNLVKKTSTRDFFESRLDVPTLVVPYQILGDAIVSQGIGQPYRLFIVEMKMPGFSEETGIIPLRQTESMMRSSIRFCEV